MHAGKESECIQNTAWSQINMILIRFYRFLSYFKTSILLLLILDRLYKPFLPIWHAVRKIFISIYTALRQRLGKDQTGESQEETDNAQEEIETFPNVFFIPDEWTENTEHEQDHSQKKSSIRQAQKHKSRNKNKKSQQGKKPLYRNNTILDLHSKYCTRTVWTIRNAEDHL